MKIRCNLKTLKMSSVVILIRTVFNDNNYYPQALLEE